MRKLFVLAVIAGAATSANAFEFQCRFVERVGNIDTPIPGNTLANLLPGVPHRIRVQFGVFDDATSAAPDGGFVGWNIGSISVSGAASNSQDRRTPGRVSPFNFAAGVNSNGNPPPPTLNGPDAVGFDFQMLTDIDATLGTQGPAWPCVDLDGDGVHDDPNPPAPLIRGRNAFVSVYEITTTPGALATDYSITFGGNLIAAQDWRFVGTPNPPDCENGVAGSVTYAPFPLPPQPISCTLNLMIIPAPGAAALLGLGGLIVARRRRA
jgi:hypothetical protein